MLTEATCYALGLVYMRALGFVYFLPFWNTPLLPRLVRLSIPCLLAWLLAASVADGQPLPDNFWIAGLALGKEFLVGLFMSLVAYVMIFVATLGGSIIATEIGFSMASTFDPFAESQTTAIDTLLMQVTLLLVFIYGVHYELMIAFKNSFTQAPLGLGPWLRSVEGLTRAISAMFATGLQMAAPVVAIHFLVNISFAVLGKAAPKFNAFMLSFPVRILAGLGVLLIAFEVVMRYSYQSMSKAAQTVLECLIY
jgi:flagellar biosynthetic protein FliR